MIGLGKVARAGATQRHTKKRCGRSAAQEVQVGHGTEEEVARLGRQRRLDGGARIRPSRMATAGARW